MIFVEAIESYLRCMKFFTHLSVDMSVLFTDISCMFVNRGIAKVFGISCVQPLISRCVSRVNAATGEQSVTVIFLIISFCRFVNRATYVNP